MNKLEQLERLRSEEHYWALHNGSQAQTIEQFILDPKSKQDKANVTNFRNLPKLQFF